MILADASFIVATISANDAYYDASMKALKSIREPLISTWPCITEAMHLIGLRRHEALRRQIEEGFLLLHTSTQEGLLRCCVLMRKYEDSPMDFADASLVAAAEALEITRILTYDQHFYSYRINGSIPFEVMP